MRYMTLVIHGDVMLEEALKEQAQLDWRLHTLTLVRSNPVAHYEGLDTVTNVWHVVMEKGTF